MSNEITIWNDNIYGLIFRGRDPALDAPCGCLSADNKIVIFTIPGKRGGGALLQHFFATEALT